MILLKNLVASGLNGGLLRTFVSIQWQCELYRGRPKTLINSIWIIGWSFFQGKNLQVQQELYYILYKRLIKVYGQDCVCVIAPFPINPNTAEDFDPGCDVIVYLSGAKA